MLNGRSFDEQGRLAARITSSIALGMTMVIIASENDISVGSVIAFLLGPVRDTVAGGARRLGWSNKEKLQEAVTNSLKPLPDTSSPEVRDTGDFRPLMGIQGREE